MLQKLTIEESYLSGLAGDSEIISHFQNRRRDVMKSEGAVYTPLWIVQAMLRRLKIEDLTQKIIEPSAGHGSFVIPLIRHVHKKFRLGWDDTARWFMFNVTCLDIDSETVAELQTIVAMLFKREGVTWLRASDLRNIKVADGLTVDAQEYDIAIGNPPYIRTQQMAPEYRRWLRDTFEVAQRGNVDIYYAFLDHYMKSVPHCVFIVPNGCIKASGARRLRERIFPFISEIVDFKSELVFPNARTYTCILTSQHDHSGPLSLRLGVDDKEEKVEWLSLTGSDIHSAPRVAKSGLATLSDACFRVTRNRTNNTYEARYDGKVFPIEAGILRPLYKVTKLSAIKDICDPESFIIFPYNSLNGKDVMSESQIAHDYPLAHTYLLAVKCKLMARDRGNIEKYPAWYAYGRTQGLHDLSDADLVFIPTMIGGASLPRAFDTRSITAGYGSPLFVSGFAVTSTQECRDLLLSEKFLDYVRQHGTPKPGAYEPFYAISSKHINAFLAQESVCNE